MLNISQTAKNTAIVATTVTSLWGGVLGGVFVLGSLRENNHNYIVVKLSQQTGMVVVIWRKFRKFRTFKRKSWYFWYQPSPPWKSQIAHLDMHHLVFGINFQIHSVSLAILVSIHLLIHFSTHLCHHLHSRHPSLLHYFTPGSKPTFSTNLSHRLISFTYWTASR